MVSVIKMKNPDFRIVVHKSEILITRDPITNKLNIPFKPKYIDVFNAKNEKICTLSDTYRIDSFADNELFIGFDLDNHRDFVTPFKAINYFELLDDNFSYSTVNLILK
jgi:hypothetical protein